MPKKILVEQLRVGMYLSGLEGRWLDHPFWRSRFLIRDEATLAKLHDCGVRECFIDPSKGEDLLPPLPDGVASPPPPAPEPAPEGPPDPAPAASLATPTDSPMGDELDVELEVAMAEAPEAQETATATDDQLIKSAFGEWADAPQNSAAPAAKAEPTSPATASRRRRQVVTPAEQAFADELERAATVLERAGVLARALNEAAVKGQVLPVAEARAVMQAMLASLAREPSALVSLARLKRHDEYAWRHPVAVAALMLALSAELGLDAATTEAAGLAGLVHDIGHASLPDGLLQHPGALDAAQTAQVHTHVASGDALLVASKDWPAAVREASAQHHERLDGSGYPAGLAGDAICRLARMLAVCDVYDALSSNRPYQHALEPAEAIARISASKNLYDAAIVSAFVRRLGLYPVGSLVEMESQRLAVVIWQNAIAMSDPMVRVFYSLQERSRMSPELIDLSAPDAKDFVIGRVSASDWPVGNVEALWSHGHASRILGPGAHAGRATLAGPLRE
jgi:HD-GYP domain-containing protein (c-di-GMP phosphodiesterase class II)